MYYLLLSHIHHPYFYSIYCENGTESFVLFPTSNISLSNTSNVTTPRLENIISIFSLTAQIRWPRTLLQLNWFYSLFVLTFGHTASSVPECRAAAAVPRPDSARLPGNLVSVCQEPTSTASCSWWRAAWSPPS